MLQVCLKASQDLTRLPNLQQSNYMVIAAVMLSASACTKVPEEMPYLQAGMQAGRQADAVRCCKAQEAAGKLFREVATRTSSLPAG